MKNNFKVVKNFIPYYLAEFCNNYLRLKKECFFTYSKNNLLDQQFQIGIYNDNQVDNAFAIYGDVAMETLLVMLKPSIEKILKIDLIPTYAYARHYDFGSELKRHKDRMSCDYSVTLNLGGDVWPIFLEPDPKKGKSIKNKYIPSKSKGKKVNLKQGDLIIYRGCLIEHWREPFKGNYCTQVFLHYNKAEETSNIFDGRPHLGLPSNFKKKVFP
jgi:hypothetical protein